MKGDWYLGQGTGITEEKSSKDVRDWKRGARGFND